MAQVSTRLSLGRAILWILLSTLLISGSATASWLYYQHLITVRKSDPAFDIAILVQTGPEREVLRTDYLAELLDLSIDKPTNLYTLDPSLAEKKLLLSPVIKEASVQTYLPGTVYVDYTVREPVAYLADYRNTAIDEEGYLFPCEPFFTPKKLPEIYLGLPSHLTSEEVWSTQIQDNSFLIARQVLKEISLLSNGRCRVVKVDVSKALVESYGQRQIVLIVEDTAFLNHMSYSFPRVLRLSPAHYQDSLKNYERLHWHMLSHKSLPTNFSRMPVQVIDLRLLDLAYISEI